MRFDFLGETRVVSGYSNTLQTSGTVPHLRRAGRSSFLGRLGRLHHPAQFLVDRVGERRDVGLEGVIVAALVLNLPRDSARMSCGDRGYIVLGPGLRERGPLPLQAFQNGSRFRFRVDLEVVPRL